MINTRTHGGGLPEGDSKHGSSRHDWCLPRTSGPFTFNVPNGPASSFFRPCRLLLTLLLACLGAGLAQAQQPLNEEDFLARVTAEPAVRGVVIGHLAADAVGSRESFDQAYRACSEAVKSGEPPPGVRTNLGALLLRRDRFYPTETGSFSRAVNQWYLVLRQDPACAEARYYLGAEAVLWRAKNEFSTKELEVYCAALKRAAYAEPQTPSSYAALARSMLVFDRTTEALFFADSWIRLSQGSEAKVFYGVALVKDGRDREAAEQLTRSLPGLLASDFQQAALCAAAQASLRSGRLEDAETFLAQVSGEAPSSANACLQAYALPGKPVLTAELGKRYSDIGDSFNAVRVLGADSLQWLSSERAFNANRDGNVAFETQDYAKARRLFREAHDLIPLEPVYLSNLAWVCTALGRYREAAASYRSLEGIRTLSARQALELARADLILGKDTQASDALLAQAEANRDKEWLAQWAVVAAYAAYGKAKAEQYWCRLLGRGGNLMNNQERYAAFALVRGGLRDFSEKAHAARMNYQALHLDSLLYRALGEALNSPLLSNEGRANVRSERTEVWGRIVDTYGRLPLKPAPTERALRLAAQAGAQMENGQWWVAVPNYYSAVEEAPYWPEGHFMLGAALNVARHYDDFWLNMANAFSPYGIGSLTDKEGLESSTHLNACLRLQPAGPLGRRAQELLLAPKKISP